MDDYGHPYTRFSGIVIIVILYNADSHFIKAVQTVGLLKLLLICKRQLNSTDQKPIS